MLGGQDTASPGFRAQHGIHHCPQAPRSPRPPRSRRRGRAAGTSPSTLPRNWTRLGMQIFSKICSLAEFYKNYSIYYFRIVFENWQNRNCSTNPVLEPWTDILAVRSRARGGGLALHRVGGSAFRGTEPLSLRARCEAMRGDGPEQGWDLYPAQNISEIVGRPAGRPAHCVCV